MRPVLQFDSNNFHAIEVHTKCHIEIPNQIELSYWKGRVVRHMFNNNEGNIRVDWIITHGRNMTHLIRICNGTCETCRTIAGTKSTKRQIFIRTQLKDTNVPNIGHYSSDAHTQQPDFTQNPSTPPHDSPTNPCTYSKAEA